MMLIPGCWMRQSENFGGMMLDVILVAIEIIVNILLEVA
jgi:hypothetical protein